jgi:predicted aconitase with swiveling domain
MGFVTDRTGGPGMRYDPGPSFRDEADPRTERMIDARRMLCRQSFAGASVLIPTGRGGRAPTVACHLDWP